MYHKIFRLIYFLSAFVIHGVISFDSNESDENFNIEEEIENNDKNWDVLIFTQQWPVTTCYHWMEEDHTNECNMPNEKEFWTIHGIWPTKYGTSGPGFCNKTAKFDINKLNDFINDLKLYWPEIEIGPEYDSLWKHEWLKHGTCASSITQLDNEAKYFYQGLKWRTKYLISMILGNSNIHPDSENTVINIHNALKKFLNYNPSIHCLYDRKKDISYLSEIRICFNKTLELIDCDGVLGDAQIAIDYPGGKVITNCHISKPVKYPSIVPPLLKNSWKFPFVNFYKLLNFIMWSTL